MLIRCLLFFSNDNVLITFQTGEESHKRFLFFPILILFCHCQADSQIVYFSLNKLFCCLISSPKYSLWMALTFLLRKPYLGGLILAVVFLFVQVQSTPHPFFMIRKGVSEYVCLVWGQGDYDLNYLKINQLLYCCGPASSFSYARQSNVII